MQPINKRKRVLPPKKQHTPQPTTPQPTTPQPTTKNTSEVIQPTNLLPHEQRKHALHAQYPMIPLTCIFVDRTNGVELFQNPASGGWCSRAETVLPYYTLT